MTPPEIEKIFRDEAGRALATLIRLVGDFDLAQDALQDAFAVALERWPAADPPSNPRAWLVNVGRNKAIDRVRRQVTFRGKRSELTHELLSNAAVSDEAHEATTLDDDMLRLIFTCCHPAFAADRSFSGHLGVAGVSSGYRQPQSAHQSTPALTPR